MADANTSLPVRTQSNGDVVAFIADGTVSTQLLKVNSDGSIPFGNISAVADFNYGLVGAQTLRTAAEIGNSTGAADFNFGASSAQTLRVAALLGNAAGVIDYNYGAVGAQTIRTASEIGNATGAASFNYGAASAQTLRTAAQIGNATGAADFNYGTIGAQSLRVASQVGNAAGAADFNNGVTGAQTLRVAANLAVAGADVTNANPVPVTITNTPAGTLVNKYNTTSSLAAGSSANHDYTITSGKTLSARKFWASASGKIKADVKTSPDGVTFTTYWTGFNSTATPNIDIDLNALEIQDSGTGSVVRITITNDDLQAFNVYSTISGVEN